MWLMVLYHQRVQKSLELDVNTFSVRIIKDDSVD